MWPFLSRKYTVELFIDALKAWRWRIRHRNGQILSSSEAYSDRRECTDTARALADAARFRLVVFE